MYTHVHFHFYTNSSRHWTWQVFWTCYMYLVPLGHLSVGQNHLLHLLCQFLVFEVEFQQQGSSDQSWTHAFDWELYKTKNKYMEQGHVRELKGLLLYTCIHVQIHDWGSGSMDQRNWCMLTHWHLELFAKIVFFWHFGGFEAGSWPN